MERRTAATGAVALTLAIMVTAPTSAVASDGSTRPPTHSITLESVGYDGLSADQHCSSPQVSSRGRYVVYTSNATNFVEDDDGYHNDIFVTDTRDSTTELITRGRDGEFADDDSAQHDISANGRFTTYVSYARNLDPYEGETYLQVFLHDRRKGESILVSRNADGDAGNAASSSPAISADGRFIVYESMAKNLVSQGKNLSKILLYDRLTKETTLVSRTASGETPNDDSWVPEINADGTVVTYSSRASNLDRPDNNGYTDVFRVELATGEVELISRTPDGQSGIRSSRFSSISDDGRFLAYESTAWDLLPGDENEDADAFLYDHELGTTTLVNATPDGGFPADTEYGTSFVKIAPDGRWVAFTSDASDLVPGDDNGDPDVYRRDPVRERTKLINVALDGGFSIAGAGGATWAPNGQTIVFQSAAPDLVDDYDVVATINIFTWRRD